jgi:hypothetical protein
MIVSSFSKVFAFDRTFGEVSEEANEVWEEMFPPHGGFFNHPTIAPQRSTFSVFHQLHCLVLLLASQMIPIINKSPG